MTIAISLMSMAVAVRDWASAQGRLPRITECTKNTGFPHHFATFYRHLGAPVDLSALVAIAPPPSTIESVQGIRACLRCDRTFPAEGAHVRLCTRCRHRLFREG